MCLFLLTFYRVLGAIAIGGLVIYGIYYFALIKLIPITLTLPGIAGLILTIGIAADANIVIFERVKEEIRGGRSIVSGIATGYRRGFAAIVDANVVTFMTAFILFALATAEVKGFAFTLGIGTLLTLFTAVLATQAALGAMSRSPLVSHPAALGAARRGKGWTFDFMGASKWFFSLSGTILLIGALAIGGKGLNFGIDFKSGTRIQTAFVKPVSEKQVAAVMKADGYGNAEVQTVQEQERRRHGLSDLDRDAAPGKGREDQGGLRREVRQRLQRIRHAPLVLDLDRADVRQNGRQQRGDRDHRLAARDLRVHRAAIRVEVRDPGADRVDARSADHGGRLFADRPGSDDGDGRGAVDDPGVFAVRHDHRVRSRARERAADAARRVLADRQPLDVGGADEIVGDELLHAAAGARAAAVRRGNAEELRLRADGRVASGAYSSIFIASPVLTHWKEREGSYRGRRARIVRELGRVPAYATALGGEPVDVEPTQERKRTRRGSITAPEEPGEQISSDEFQELVRDLDVDAEPKQRAVGSRRCRADADPAGAAR